jgi:hypothetical protein
MKLFFFHLIPSVCMGFNHSSHVTSWQQTLACLGKVLLNSPLCQADSTTNRHAYKDDYHSIHPGQARRSRVPLLTMLVVASQLMLALVTAKKVATFSHVLPFFHAHRRERQLLTRHLAVAALRESVTRLRFAPDTREHTRGPHQQSCSP